jgi:putative SOS response-associated peptidase YedK
MCGRYSQTTSIEELNRLFGVTERVNLPPRYNIAPTQDAPVVRLDKEGARQLLQMRWGLIPFWAKDQKIGNRLINARAESVATNASFRDAFKARHCLVAADGFYEWSNEGGKKRPWRITLADGGPFAFAGLWERWRDAAGAWIRSFTILTTDANALVKPIHDRMPVILDPKDHEAWLSGRDSKAQAALLRPFPAEAMRAYRVNPIVNNARVDEPACIEPLAEEPVTPRLL